MIAGLLVTLRPMAATSSKKILLALVSVVSLAACGSGGGDDGDDMTPPPDSMMSTQNVTTVACQGGEPVVTADLGAFDPMSTTIAVGGRVEFDLTATHPMASTTAGQTFSAPGGASTCLQFAAAGTYTFRCTVHSFTGSVVVQ
jgi:plastocyanin